MPAVHALPAQIVDQYMGVLEEKMKLVGGRRFGGGGWAVVGLVGLERR